jgi:HD superfamily phosphohydrolase YqeK
MTRLDLHPLIVAAAQGRLPEWAAVRSSRRAHLAGVAALLQGWAQELGLAERDQLRWAAVAWLHDALRDADASALEADAADFPERVRHGPAVAARLQRSGVHDEELLEAIRYHSLGRAGFGRLGRFLYLADYLEPGRDFAPVENAALRARMPADHEAVLRLVCSRRIADLLDRGLPLRSETVDFWNELRARV